MMDPFTPEQEAQLDAALATIRRRTDTATLIILLLAALWFATASFGASLP